jgi:hypothetical protein
MEKAVVQPTQNTKILIIAGVTISVIGLGFLIYKMITGGGGMLNRSEIDDKDNNPIQLGADIDSNTAADMKDKGMSAIDVAQLKSLKNSENLTGRQRRQGARALKRDLIAAGYSRRDARRAARTYRRAERKKRRAARGRRFLGLFADGSQFENEQIIG